MQEQVRLFFPQEGAPGFGLIRAVVVDSDDAFVGPESMVWVDSNGFISQPADARTALSPRLAAGQVVSRA